MRSKQIFFFGLKEDLISIIKFIESNFEIKYVSAGLKDEIPFCIDTLFEDMSNIGNVKYGDWNHNEKYLILPKTKDLVIEDIPQRKGGIKYAIDQKENNESVVLFLGGQHKDNAIIASKIGTISETEFSKNIFKFASKYIKKHFKKINKFYVGTEALKKSRQEGVRLTTDVNSSLEYDLKT